MAFYPSATPQARSMLRMAPRDAIFEQSSCRDFCGTVCMEVWALSQNTDPGVASALKKTNSVAPHANATSEELLDWIVTSLDAEKAEDIVQIDLRGRSEIADYMVICSGRSTRQVTALADILTRRLKEQFDRIAKIEGKAAGDWVLLDTGDVVLHIFRPEVRDFYQLEKMWLPGGADTEAPAH